MPSRELPDPLVEIVGVTVLDAYDALLILPKRVLRCRADVHDRIIEVERYLPNGFGLVVLDGWRDLTEQQMLREFYEKQGLADGYVASTDSGAIRPPHTIGGALDVTLSYKGVPLALGTDFDSFNEEAHYAAFEDRDSLVRRLRRLLASAMLTSGFVPYPLEWWHWSYGDEVWAVENGGESLYGIARLDDQGSTEADRSSQG
jgi:D-alanyl-D-alanine dipeptidase